MGISQKWLKIIGGRFLGSSKSNRRYIIIPRTICSNESDKAFPGNETSTFEEHGGLPVYTKEEVAAIKIQACFRGHLARRAYRALRSLVKLQALVRGVFVIVRRQSRIALHCMHLLVRLQVRIRARQLLGGSLPH